MSILSLQTECSGRGVRSCYKNVASAGVARRTAATKSLGTIVNSWKLAPKGRAPRMGRVTTAVYKGVHEDSEPPRNALKQAQQFLKQLLRSGLSQQANTV